MFERDRVLAARLAAGDDEALTETFDEYGSLVFGVACRVIGSRTAAEDVVQEVFVALWRAPDRYDPERGSLRTFLCLQARCRALDALRRSARRLDATVQHSVDDPVGEAEASIAAGMVQEAIRQLPADQREVVELAYFGGRSHSEVASTLGIPLGTAKGRLRLAHAKLRRLLSPVLEEWA